MELAVEFASLQVVSFALQYTAHLWQDIVASYKMSRAMIDRDWLVFV